MNRFRTLLLLTLFLPLCACSLVPRGGSGGIAIHSPLIRSHPLQSPALPEGPLEWQLAIHRPSAERMVDSARIAVRPQPHELQSYRGVAWSMPAPALVETAVLQQLEDSALLRGVARTSAGLQADYRLVMDIRRFEADYGGRSSPTVVMEISAKLLHNTSRQIVASRLFTRHVDVDGTAVERVVPAFATALETISTDIALWSLQSGQAHWTTTAGRS